MNAKAEIALPRLQLFEFNDSARAPAPLRDLIVESLSRTLAWGHVLDDLVPPLRRFLDDAGTHDVLDLCAGAAGPAEIIAAELERVGDHRDQLSAHRSVPTSRRLGGRSRPPRRDRLHCRPCRRHRNP